MTHEGDPLILVADDNPDHLAVESILLRQAGYKVVTACDGCEAFEVAQREHPLLVISDVMMPRASGIDLCRWVRADAELSSVPILLVSAMHVDDASAVQGLQAGADDYLEAPYDPMRLVAKVTRLVERARHEEALRESEERYALAARGANDGLWDWNLRTNEFYFSPRWKQMLGFAEEEVGTRPEEWFSRVHTDDVGLFKATIADHVAGRTPHFEVEHRVRHRDGTYRWMLSRGMAVRDSAGKATRMSGSQTDITERKLTEEQLLHDALHDALTSLPNRALFMDRLGQAVERARRHAEFAFAVLFLDIDRFKLVNDSLGHTAGDQLLVEFGRRLTTSLRAGDTVARMGGDEFTVLLGDVADAADAIRMAERIEQGLARPFDIGGHELFASASIGIALSALGCDHPEDMLRDANIAMHRAKSAGKSCIRVFDTTMHERAVALLRLETDLRRTPGRQEYVVQYQPILSLKTGAVCGFEALARWQHPERGMLYPDEFIPLAEETGLIIDIDRWVMREACTQARAWQGIQRNVGPLAICVNLSARQFTHTGLVGYVEKVLSATGLDPRSLKLEITESVLMSDAETVTTTLERLKALGVELYLDDFGTGYSSLNYLHRFPIDVLKIDRCFISRMGADGRSSEVVRAIVTLAHELGMSVVAEGVETEGQLAEIRSLGCEYAQGHLFSVPVDAESAGALIDALTLPRPPRFHTEARKMRRRAGAKKQRGKAA
jgi:diguanylate cyclase (GGDEF)-like protein/PAS domain S-box-containing protein